MPRRSRTIAVGYPHHVTQRGNDRRVVFIEEDDYSQYRKWLSRYARKYGLDIWAYCLMPNHVHAVVVPQTPEALAQTFNLVHMQYAQYINDKTHSTGHVWQGRYFSCVLDEPHLYAAIRYVEMNPVRGKLAASAKDYPWSSAGSHISGQPDSVLSGHCFLTDTVKDWGRYLAEDLDPTAKDDLIKATASGRPCGGEDFLRQMEALLGRRFIALPAGRPSSKKKTEEPEQK
ncbi:MAG: transposase [Proteobacteria bacterium]|nr:transposase [Pseudomonadota bacterium]